MPKPENTTTRDKLLVFGILGAFMSLTIVMGNFSSPGSWAPTVVTAAASSTANCVRKTMSNQYPFSPSEPSSDLSEVSQSPWPQRQYGALI